MRISDWSSDVCSSDLLAVVAFDPPCLLGRQLVLPAAGATGAEEALAVDRALDEALLRLQLLKLLEGRELDRSPDARLVGRDAEVAGDARELVEGVGEQILVANREDRSEEHTSEIQSLMRNSYAG